MWATLPPVVSVGTTADELAGVSMATHSSGMMYESKCGSCTHCSTLANSDSKPIALATSPMANQLPSERTALLSDPQCGRFNAAPFSLSVVSDCGACGIPLPGTVATPSRAGSTGASQDPQAALTSRQRQNHESPLSQPAVCLSPPESLVQITTSPPACVRSVSAVPRQAAVFPGQHIPSGGLNGNPNASSLIGVTEADTRKFPGVPHLCMSGPHQGQLSYLQCESPVSITAGEGRLGGAVDASAVIVPSSPSHAHLRSTLPENSGVSVASLQPTPAGVPNGPAAATATADSFQGLCRPPLTSPATTATSEGEVVSPSRATAEYTIQIHQGPGPLGGQPHAEPGASALPTPPQASATSSGGSISSMLPPVPCSLNPQRGGVGSLCDTSGDIGETSLTMFASMSCLPRKPPKGCAGLHSRYVPPLSHWKASDMSSSSTGGTTSAPATDGATIALSQHMTPRSHRITTTQPGNDGSVNANASGVGHIHFQEVSPTHSSMQLHSSTLKRLSFTGTGQQPLVQADDSSLNFTGPRRHVESFYTGTPGNDSLRRSFFFPSSSPGHAAVATEGAGGSSFMTASGGALSHDMTSHLHFPSTTRGGSLGQPTPPAVAINGAALARKFSAAGSILADSYCSPTLLDAPEFPSASHPPQWQEPSYPLPSRLQHSLQITPATPARAVPPPGPHRNAVSQGLQVASHHEAPPDIGQPPDASSVPGMDRRESQCQLPGLLPLHPSDWRSLSVAVASASEAGRNTALLETSLVSPTLARSQWRCRFEESFSSAEEAFQSADARAQMPASAAAAPAAGGGRGGVRARLTSLTSSSRLTQSPAYILDWERSLAAFKDRAERYYSFKGICTETYLTLIEHSVDRFLVCYFSGGSGTIRPEDAVQVALASHTGSATRATPHVLGDTSAGNSDVRGSSSPGPGGKGIQKMLQGSKTLQKLSETGSKWLVRMGANLRRTGAVVTSVPSEPKTSLMSTTSPVSQNPLTFGDTRASLQRGVEGTIPGCKMTPTSTSATVAASAAMGIRVPDTTYASLYGDDPLDLRSALGPPPEQPHAPVINGSAPSKSTSQLSLTLSVHQEVSAGMDCSASTPDTIFPSCVSPEEAEIQCLLQLGHYVADVIPDTFMDTRPSDSVIHQVRCNYAILLYTLQHILRDSSIRSRQGSVSDSFCTDGAPSLSFALTQTLRPTSSTTVRGPLPLTVDELVCQRIRYGLLLPTIQTTWRDFLAPLEAKVQELVQIASTNIDPILGELQAACDKEADIDAATAVSPASLANPGSGVRPDSTAVAAALVRGKTLPFREITETERAAREALRAAWEGPLARLIRLLRKDEEYLSTIHTMDDEFVENGTAWHLRSAQMRMCCTALSDYVPVYGLVLSRLHRLEMEHRTVLELWGGSGAAVTAGRQ